MMRLFLLLALALGQAQPAAAALLCEQHHASGRTSGESSHQGAGHDGAPLGHQRSTPGDHQCTPMPHDCAVMTNCTITASALVPSTDAMAAAAAVGLLRTGYLPAVPPTVSAARPFHPPKS
ncbi:MAG: hypothetical protein SFU57_08910 [Gemmatimonadales bacterium]|nr:hypothetical protein [Gemmatimonadales bacterium]